MSLSKMPLDAKEVDTCDIILEIVAIRDITREITEQAVPSTDQPSTSIVVTDVRNGV